MVLAYPAAILEPGAFHQRRIPSADLCRVNAPPVNVAARLVVAVKPLAARAAHHAARLLRRLQFAALGREFPPRRIEVDTRLVEAAGASPDSRARSSPREAARPCGGRGRVPLRRAT
jgi:hypothetical protein